MKARTTPSQEPSKQGRGRGIEAWCLATGSPAEREAAVRVFGAWRWTQVLAPEGGEPAQWAAALARASGSALERHAALEPAREGEGVAELAERVLGVLERALAGGAERLLLVLAPELPALVAARALGMPLERAGALLVDPGHALLLRDDAHGFTLRRSNAPAPVSDEEEDA